MSKNTDSGSLKGRRVLISTFIPPSEGGGVERFLFMLSEILTRNGYEVKALSRNEDDLLERHIRPYSAWRIGRRIWREHREGDIVLCNNYFSWNAPRTDSIVIFHGTEKGRAEATQDVYPKLRNLLVGVVNSRLDKRAMIGRVIVAVSNATQQEIHSYYGGTVDRVIPNAVDTDAFVPEADKKRIRRTLGLPEDEFLVLCVGIDDPRKGSEIIRNTIIPGLKGRQRVVVVGRATNAPEGVVLLGPVPFDRMSNVYAACDALVMPSYYEGCGFVILEALSCGTPSIVPPTGVGKDLLTDPILSGYVVPCSEPEGYVERLLRLQNSREEWHRVSCASRKAVVDSYDVKRFEHQYLSLFHSIAYIPQARGREPDL